MPKQQLSASSGASCCVYKYVILMHNKRRIKGAHMHEFIEHYLDSYISNTEADYAVMLTGEWGSGKTYFVKEYFTERSLTIE